MAPIIALCPAEAQRTERSCDLVDLTSPDAPIRNFGARGRSNSALKRQAHARACEGVTHIKRAAPFQRQTGKNAGMAAGAN
jgi:hypothetical protein